MKPAHLSKDAGQIVNVDDKIKTLSDYIVQVQADEKLVEDFKVRMRTFDRWWDTWSERLYKFTTIEDAARAAWNAAREDL